MLRHNSWTPQFRTWTPTEILLRSQETRGSFIRNVLFKSIFSRQMSRRLGNLERDWATGSPVTHAQSFFSSVRPNDSYDPWNAVSTKVRLNVKCHRGINQCNTASDKIIEVRSNGRKVRSNEMEVRSNGRKIRSNEMEVRSNGMEVRSNGRKIRSNGMEVRSSGTRVRSNGMQGAIRLHFCPECPSIFIYWSGN